MRLDLFRNPEYRRGASPLKEALWLATSGILVESWIPGSGWRDALLRLFGAEIGTGVVIKPRVKVKFPWRLVVGDYSWIGERVWIDNLEQVTIGSHVCLSQGVYLCTGSHDWTSETFDLITRPISVSDHAWVGAFAVLAPGTTVGEGAVLAMGKTGSGTLPEWTIQKHHGVSRRVIDQRN